MKSPAISSMARHVSLGTISLIVFTGVVFVGCAENPPAESFKVAYRQSPPEPVYSRLMWSHLPDPIKPKSTEDAPYYLPTITVELPNSTLGEAIEAVATTMGYRWDYPERLGKRPIHLKMEGTVEEILKEINRQGKVRAVLDHPRRLVRVGGNEVQPSLPRSR